MNVQFKDFAKVVNEQLELMSKGQLYIVNVNGRELGKKYLDYFPEGTNPEHREKRVYECDTCLSFIRKIGNVVAIKDNKLVSIWDVEIGGYYQEVADRMAEYVKSFPIDNIYITEFLQSGEFSNIEHATAHLDVPTRWYHFNFKAPEYYYHAQPDAVRGNVKTNAQTLERALVELKLDAGTEVLELILDNNLEKGPEYQQIVMDFVNLKRRWNSLDTEEEKNVFIWLNVSSHVCGIKNDVIGTLLVDLSGKVIKLDETYVEEDGDIVIGRYVTRAPKTLEDAVNAFEHKVSGENFKRPNPIITEAMAVKAMKAVEAKGIRGNLDRRFANMKDVSTNDTLWSDAKKASEMKDALAEVLMAEVKPSKNIDKNAIEVSINEFLDTIVRDAVSIKALVENHHTNNFVSLIAPMHVNDNHLFKWDNECSWTYRGDVADTIKQRVIEAGGSTQGVARFSLIWDNIDDLDLHILEPGGHIYHASRTSHTSGTLDIDKNVEGSELTSKAVENVIYTDLDMMPDGEYRAVVQNYQARDPKAENFKLQVAIGDEVKTFTYKGKFPNKAELLTVSIMKDGRDLTICNISSKVTSNEEPMDIWGLKTQKFADVTSIMLSPNFWHGQTIGNKHFIFTLDGCLNPTSARGIYNEYLRNDLRDERKAFEVIGSKMKCEFSDNQLSGLGFPSTKDGQLVCKVTDRQNKTTTYKINIK